ncbi:MAG TPA: asparaginase [Thermomicrobiales bacterium]|nr:asparaginase [Thermomicrobiales bacterium]
MPATRPRIVVITTGGTIGSRRDPATGAVSAVASADELVALAPEIAATARIELMSWVSVNSWNMTPEMMFDLAQDARAVLARPDVAGVVITHGTDTVEETGVMAELLVDSPKPVVFVVAMRHLSETGADGPRNFADAVRVAAAPESRNRGTLLVANEQIHAVRYVTKTNATNAATFVSPDYGPVGLVQANAIRYLHSPAPRRALDVARPGGPVHVVKAVSGSDASLLEWLCEQGTRGIVIEGSGAGNVPAAMLPGIGQAIRAGIPVVLTSRALWGFLSATYGSGGASGGGFDLLRMGVIPANHLPAQKARIVLMLGLGAGLSHDELRDLLAEP